MYTHPGRWPDRHKAEGRVGGVTSVFIPEWNGKEEEMFSFHVKQPTPTLDSTLTEINGTNSNQHMWRRQLRMQCNTINHHSRNIFALMPCGFLSGRGQIITKSNGVSWLSNQMCRRFQVDSRVKEITSCCFLKFGKINIDDTSLWE